MERSVRVTLTILRTNLPHIEGDYLVAYGCPECESEVYFEQGEQFLMCLVCGTVMSLRPEVFFFEDQAVIH